MKKLIYLVLLCSAQVAFAQKASKPEQYAKTITADDLKRHLYIVASKEMAGRETGMPGERKAAAYIENEFKRIGLQPGNNGSYHMFFNVYQDSLVDAALEVNGQKYSIDKDYTVNVGNSSDATLRFSEVVFVGSGTADSVKNMNLAGRLVMVQGSAGYQFLLNKGVAGIMYIGSNFPRTTASFRKGAQTINLFKRTIRPQEFTVSEEVAKAILKADFETSKNDKALLKTYTAEILLDVRKTSNPLQTSNVIGVLPGTDLKDEYLFITAHHDHIGQRDTIINYGADDDGSGTVSVIELAEAFSKAKAAGKGPRRTIVFMTVSGEEKGLWGSDYYASRPIFPLEKTTADLNIDMIGRIDPQRKQGDSMNYVYVVGDDKLSSDLRPISESVNKKYTKLELDYKFNDPKDPMRIYFRSDHYNFAKHGVPIIFYFNGTHADYHRSTDTPDKINYPLMAKRAQFVFYTAWEMANRNQMLKRDIPLQIPPR